MSVSFASHVQPFVTIFTPEEIKQGEESFKDVEVVYLQSETNTKYDNYVDDQDKIFVGLQKDGISFKSFHSVEQCVEYLRKNDGRKFRLILQNALDKETESTLMKYTQVLFIFQFNSPNPWIKKENAQSDSQTTGPSMKQLLNARHHFMGYSTSQNVTNNISTTSPWQEFMTKSCVFVYHQVLTEVLFRTILTAESMNDFVEYSRENCSENPTDIKAIDRFNLTFKSGQAIEWYTAQTFVNRIVGRAFATNDLHIIFNTRHFTCHLVNEVKDLHERTISIYGSPVRVYRGKTMLIRHFEELKLSVGQLVITKSFVSTSLELAVAKFFAGDTNVRAGYVNVIFHMKIDKSENKSELYAYIGNKSKMPDEAEVLLGSGIIFRNKEINKIKENMFIVKFVHTSAEEEIQEQFIRLNTSYLDGASNIVSPDTSESFIINVLNPLDIPVTPQPSTVQSNEHNNQPIAAQPTPMVQQQIIQQANGTLYMPARKKLNKKLYRDITRLKLLDKEDANPRFRVRDTPFTGDEDDEQLAAHSAKEHVVTGLIFPNSEIYRERAYLIEMKLNQTFPIDSPEVRFLTPIYHPNVSQDGKFCTELLLKSHRWTPTTTLVEVLKAVVDLIDNINLEYAESVELGKEYRENRPEFNRKALAYVLRHGLPR